MLKFCISLLFILPLFAVAQTIDSAAIRQVDSLIKVSRALAGKSDFNKALEVNAIAEKIALEKLGRESTAYGSICFNHGRTLYLKNEYTESEKWYLESKAIREKLLGKEHPDYAWCLNNLASLYSNIGQYEKAELLHLEAKSIREKVLSKKHPEYASSLNNLGRLYMNMGKYEKAEPLLFESKVIMSKALGIEHPDYATILTNLANLYMEMGQYEKAEPIFLEAKAIREKKLGKEHPVYAASLNNLAVLYEEIGQYQKAEPLFLEAVTVWANLVGKEHPDYAAGLNNLANLYCDMGQYEKAEPLNLEALAIREKVLGKEHPSYAQSLKNLADVYLTIRKYKKAETLYLEALAIRKKVLGKEHPGYAQTLNDLANLYSFMGQYEKAETLYNSSAELMRIIILSALHHLSEKEMNQYILTFNKWDADIFSFNQKTSAATGIVKTGYDNTLFFKGFLLNAYNHSKQLILSNAVATEKYRLLQSYSRRLAAEYAKPITERQGVTELEEKSNALEKELAQTVAGYGEAMRQVKWQEVQQKLKKDEAAIEFVYYQYIDLKKTDSMMYAALLIKPGNVQPEFIPLFEEKSIDSLLQSNNGLKADYVNGLYSLTDRGIKINKDTKANLYEMLWKPLEKELTGIKTIYYSPAGLLHRINLDAIPVSATETLADKFQLVELNSTRQLVIPGEVKRVNNNAVLLGGIKFDSNEGDSLTRGGSFEDLAWTKLEVESLEKIMKNAGVKTEIKKGTDATEESIKKLGANNTPSPRILHIATHGYFFPDPKEKESTAPQASDGQYPVFKMSDHPMLRSGLILAGGNTGWQGGKRTLEGKEDGVLTAYEISQMNLPNTELVVLSACETGLGTIQGNEGVYGLQRAFKIAGAKYLIMSLWQVPDKQTSLLMTAFYKKWLTEKKPIPRAFHEAQKQLRESGLDPYYWAGFVLVE